MGKLNILKQILKIIGLLFLVLFGISIFRALILHEPPVLDYCNPNDQDYVSDTAGLLKRFSEALKFRTVSYDTHNYEREALSGFVNFISKSENNL